MQYKSDKFSQEDISALFVAALFHDYDPLKQFDKPHEDAVEWFIRHDEKIKKFIDDVGINIDIVIAIIHRTAYPYKGRIAEHAEKRMEELFTRAGLTRMILKKAALQRLGMVFICFRTYCRIRIRKL